MAKKKFDRKLSRQIDATHKAIDAVSEQSRNERTRRKLAALKARLIMLEARIP